jgi:metallo-beta-lactamase family protein
MDIDKQKMANAPKVKIHFLGAAGTVTGSKFLIQTASKQILVDCGLFQGLKELRLLNWSKLPVDVSQIDIVLLTHGHLDHTGYLPRLVKDGFSGQIWGTAPTLQIAKIILEDSARIQNEDAKRANEKGFSKHHPAIPLYDIADVEKTLPNFYPQQPDQWIRIDAGIECRFKYNGHIIGASFIELKIGEKIIVFSGDIGREHDFLMYPPQKPERADIVLIECTYGNRSHPKDAEEELTRIINSSSKKNGTIIIPSFAVERTQTLMYLIWKLREKGAIADIPVYMDSPMGTNVLEVFRNNLSWHKLTTDQCVEMCREIKLIQSIQETYTLAKSETPKIIIAGSGMASGGRVLTYFLQYLGNTTATILLAGYQAAGTRGRDLLDGTKEIKIFGKYFSVKAAIENITGLSSHADQAELIGWLAQLTTTPSNIFLVHGEEEALQAMKDKIEEVYHWHVTIPKLNEVVSV